MRYIPLTRGLKAKVDDEDFIFLSKFNWYADKSHYSSVVDDTETEAKAMVKKQLRRGKAKAATKRPEERRPSKRMQKRILKKYYELQPSKKNVFFRPARLELSSPPKPKSTIEHLYDFASAHSKEILYTVYGILIMLTVIAAILMFRGGSSTVDVYQQSVQYASVRQDMNATDVNATVAGVATSVANSVDSVVLGSLDLIVLIVVLGLIIGVFVKLSNYLRWLR